jgi:4-hydroxybenzoate polyprenyltransferase
MARKSKKRTTRSRPITEGRRSNAQKAKEQRVRRNLALGFNAFALTALAGFAVFRHQSLSRTGHFPVPVSILLLLLMLVGGALWSLFDWQRNR